MSEQTKTTVSHIYDAVLANAKEQLSDPKTPALKCDLLQRTVDNIEMYYANDTKQNLSDVEDARRDVHIVRIMQDWFNNERGGDNKGIYYISDQTPAWRTVKRGEGNVQLQKISNVWDDFRAYYARHQVKSTVAGEVGNVRLPKQLANHYRDWLLVICEDLKLKYHTITAKFTPDDGELGLSMYNLIEPDLTQTECPEILDFTLVSLSNGCPIRREHWERCIYYAVTFPWIKQPWVLTQGVGGSGKTAIHSVAAGIAHGDPNYTTYEMANASTLNDSKRIGGYMYGRVIGGVDELEAKLDAKGDWWSLYWKPYADPNQEFLPLDLMHIGIVQSPRPSFGILAGNIEEGQRCIIKANFTDGSVDRRYYIMDVPRKCYHWIGDAYGLQTEEEMAAKESELWDEARSAGGLNAKFYGYLTNKYQHEHIGLEEGSKEWRDVVRQKTPASYPEINALRSTTTDLPMQYTLETVFAGNNPAKVMGIADLYGIYSKVCASVGTVPSYRQNNLLGNVLRWLRNNNLDFVQHESKGTKLMVGGRVKNIPVPSVKVAGIVHDSTRYPTQLELNNYAAEAIQVLGGIDPDAKDHIPSNPKVTTPSAAGLGNLVTG